MDRGWFKMPDNILREGSPVQRVRDYVVLSILMSRAQWKEGPVVYKGRQCWLKQGEVCISQNDLAKAAEMTRKQIRGALDYLKKVQILGQANGQAQTTEVPHYFINLDAILNPVGPVKGPSEGQARAKRGPTDLDSQTLRLSDSSEPRPNSEHESQTHSQAPTYAQPDGRAYADEQSEIDDLFEQWWRGWTIPGTKRGKKKARQAFAKALKVTDGDVAPLIRGLQRYMALCQAEGTLLRNIKHPEGWLNGERWNDELIIPVGQPLNGDRHDRQPQRRNAWEEIQDIAREICAGEDDDRPEGSHGHAGGSLVPDTPQPRSGGLQGADFSGMGQTLDDVPYWIDEPGL